LRKYFQNKNMQNSSKVVDTIINIQRPNHDKSMDLDIIRQKMDQDPKKTYQETYPRSYAETLEGDKKFYKEDHKDTPPPKRFRF
jgi:hypothetical protein